MKIEWPEKGEYGEIWFDNYNEAEQYCYEYHIWIGNIERTQDKHGRYWNVVPTLVI